MKRIFISLSVLLLSVLCVPATAQVTFMGISIDQSYLSFNQQLSKKANFVSETTSSATYAGNFAGITGWWINVTSSGGKVGSVGASKWNLDADVMEALLDSYVKKYGGIYKQQTESPREGYQIYTYFFKSGITKIVISISFNKTDTGESTSFSAKYYPRGYINDISNVRLNSDDL